MGAEIGVCIFCGSETHGVEFLGPAGKLISFRAPEVCSSDECMAKAEKEAVESERHRQRAIGKTYPLDDMPEIFGTTDIARLHPKLQTALASFDPTKRGSSFLLHGGTRHGKTRTAWEMVKKAVKANQSYRVLTMRQIEAEVEESFIAHNHGKLLASYCSVGLLVIDDLGKERLTQRLAADLFGIIDDRTQHLRNTIVTTNLRGSEIEAKFGSDKQTAAAFSARLREFFQSVGLPANNG